MFICRQIVIPGEHFYKEVQKNRDCKNEYMQSFVLHVMQIHKWIVVMPERTTVA